MHHTRGLCAASALVTLLSSVCSAQVDLAAGFGSPPHEARPHTWWHWMNGNITKEGITADLEAMKQIGLGGAQIFNVSESIPAGPVLYMSPEWRELVKHAAAEADRLGIELCMHNCAGWSSSGGPWITPEHAMQVVVFSETKVTGPRLFSEALAQPEMRRDFYRDIAVLAFPSPQDGALRIPDIAAKAGYEARYGLQPSLDQYPAGAVVRRGSIVDLTNHLGKDGRLSWNVPAGDWTVLRIGYTPTGKENHPSPDSGRGLECDKLSREAFDAHWAGMMGPVLEDLGPRAGRVLNNALIDSYEVGPQNWTPRFREEFKQRRGYDPLLLLPVLTGRIVDSGELSERFLWDFRRTVADLFADNYFGYFAEKCRSSGLQASIEPYDGPFECLLAGRDADIPMGEFWVGGGESTSCKLAASVAHTYGRKIVGAESFTADPNAGRWQNHPYSLKGVGDLMYTTGINRYIVHRYAHQPWMDKLPGMTMGQWGTHFERTTTWWNQGTAWVDYLTRCQYLLQQGLFVADVCYFAGEAAPNGAPFHPGLKAKGYDYDACGADVLLHRASVRNGLIVLPDGMAYRVLVLPDTPFMTPRLLAKVHNLVAEGATVIGPRPERSPSLADYPGGDKVVRELAAEMWGDCDGKAVQEHRFEKGRVIWGKSAEEALATAGVPKDCEFTASGGAPKIAWIHRRLGDTDIYFVSNQKPRFEEAECTFRVEGRRPELWHPDTGVIEPAPVWRRHDGLTTVRLSFDPSGSVFVVFRAPAEGADHLVSVRPPSDASTAPTAPTIEIRRAVYEATDGAGGADVTAKVAELVAAGETSIPANNATFGDPTYMHVKRLRVEFLLNGKPAAATAEENSVLELAGPPGPSAPPSFELSTSEAGKLDLRAFRSGIFEFATASGRPLRIEAESVPPPVEVTGRWSVRFPPGRGAPPGIALDSLVSWTEHQVPGVRYFSGTAEYQTELDIPQDLLGRGRLLTLDLGRVKEIAEVTLNGRDLGIWWKPPFAADITEAARPGKNLLKVRVTNLWVNRLIGDEQYPDDCEWNGKPLRSWPRWMVEGSSRPSKNRLTFTTWKHYTKDSTLLESGLLGPVMLRPGQRIAIDLSASAPAPVPFNPNR